MGAGRGRRTGIILILLIIVVLIGAIAALFLVPCLLPGSCPAPETNGTTTGGSVDETPPPTQVLTRQVIVAARDIPRGARLSVQDVTIINWPILAEAPPPLGALLVDAEEGGAGLDQVEGRLARTDILNGQPVLDFMLTPGDQPTSLTDVGSNAALLIPQGQVAVAMPINRLSSVAYAIREGDHVDLMISVRIVDVDEEFQTILPNNGIFVTDNPDLLVLGLQGQELPVGREEPGPAGMTLIIQPNPDDERQRSRQATQLLIDNAIVLRVGNWPLIGLYEPIVVTPNPPPTPVPEGEEENAPPPPTATPVLVPDVVTLTMSRQDALVLKYMLETGADIDMALRSSLDDDVNDVVTDTVTLSYIFDFYNLTVPPKLPYAQQPRIETFADTTPGGGSSLPGENPDATPVPVQP